MRHKRWQWRLKKRENKYEMNACRGHRTLSLRNSAKIDDFCSRVSSRDARTSGAMSSQEIRAYGTSNRCHSNKSHKPDRWKLGKCVTELMTDSCNGCKPDTLCMDKGARGVEIKHARAGLRSGLAGGGDPWQHTMHSTPAGSSVVRGRRAAYRMNGGSIQRCWGQGGVTVGDHDPCLRLRLPLSLVRRPLQSLLFGLHLPRYGGRQRLPHASLRACPDVCCRHCSACCQAVWPCRRRGRPLCRCHHGYRLKPFDTRAALLRQGAGAPQNWAKGNAKALDVHTRSMCAHSRRWVCRLSVHCWGTS